MTTVLHAVVLFAAVCTAAAKIYDRCDLANELLNTYGFPRDQIPTWVCIVNYESGYDTNALGQLNSDGSADHGLFQINDRYWCYPGTGCQTSCDNFQNDDISDDVVCVKKVFDETQGLRGNGFEGWTTYDKYCSNGRGDSFIDGCNI